MAEVRRDLARWQVTHPCATFAEMETIVEQQIQRVRAQLLVEQTAAARQEEHPACPGCGTTMVPRSRSTRTVVLAGDEAVPLERVYVVCPACGVGLFPLDDQLALLPSQFSPFLVQCIVRLGTLVPFEQVPDLLVLLTGVHVAVDTVRRLTEQAGAAQVAVDMRQVEQLERELPAIPTGAAGQQVSADGAMVSLVHGPWTEVRTLAIGTLERDGEKGGMPAIFITSPATVRRTTSSDR